MGCNTNIWLPTDIDGDAAVKVVGILMGLKPVREPLSNAGGTYVEVHLTEEKPSSVAGMSDLITQALGKKTLVDGDAQHSCTFHYGARRNGKIFNLLYPVSTPLWCAVGRALVEWFGGIVEYNDCGGGKRNEFRAKRFCPVDRYKLLPDDGRAWEQYNDELMKLRPLTSLELRRGYKVAAYASDFEKDGITEKATG